MRLIDADKMRKDVLDLQNCYNGFSDTYDKAMILGLVDEQPTVDVESVRHGRWIYKGVRGRFPVCECSVCGNVENADWAVLGDNVNYCPNCGAKMDGERRDEDEPKL